MTSRKVGIITQARTTSTRLPRKVLLEVNNKTILEHHLKRLQSSGHEIFVATTINKEDEPIVKLCEKNNISFHRGSEHDVLARFHETAQKFNLDVIVRVTSDCPLIDGQLIKEAVDSYLKMDENSYVSNVIDRTYPRGFDFEIFSFKALEKAFHEAKTAPEREHVTPFIRNMQTNHGVNIVHIKRNEDESTFRLTLDEQDDWTLIRKLFEDFHVQEMNCDAIIDILKSNPELNAINAHIEQKKV